MSTDSTQDRHYRLGLRVVTPLIGLIVSIALGTVVWLVTWLAGGPPRFPWAMVVALFLLSIWCGFRPPRR